MAKQSPRDLSGVASGLAPLSEPPQGWTVPLPLPGQRITGRGWLKHEYMGRAIDATRRGSPAIADGWRQAAKVADVVLGWEPGDVDIDPTR